MPSAGRPLYRRARRGAGRFRSRKLWLVLWTQALVLGAFVYATRSPAASALYPAVVGGLLTLAGLYAAGNVASKHVDAKAGREVGP